MAIFDKLGGIAKNIGDKTTDAIETTKLNSKINGEKNAIAECMRKIGEHYYTKYQSGEAIDPALAELFTAIDGHNQNITAAQGEIERIKTDAAAPAPAAPAFAAAAPAAAPAAAGIACPSCGKDNAPGTKFCNQCGAKVEAPAPAASATRFCPECGKELPASTRFCGECGYKFEE